MSMRSKVIQALIIVLLVIVTGGSDHVLGKSVFLQKGEGGAGLDATFELDESGQVSLAMVACQQKRRSFDPIIGLYVDEKKLKLPEFEKFRAPKENSKLQLYVCVNDVCEEHEWEFLESGFGDTYFTKLSIGRGTRKIQSIRVVIPSETAKYEFRGGIDSVLKRICR